MTHRDTFGQIRTYLDQFGPILSNWVIFWPNRTKGPLRLASHLSILVMLFLFLLTAKLFLEFGPCYQKLTKKLHLVRLVFVLFQKDNMIFRDLDQLSFVLKLETMGWLLSAWPLMPGQPTPWSTGSPPCRGLEPFSALLQPGPRWDKGTTRFIM